MELELKEIISWLTALLGASGFAFGLYQYYRAQLWKKSEFAASQVQQLSDNPDLALCCVFLDWDVRRIPVPERYSVFTEEKSFKHDWNNVLHAMIPEDQKANFDWPLVLYRDVFDKFFIYLDRVNHYISIGLFEVEDVYNLKYWLDEIKSPRYMKEENKNVFMKFIDFYGYVGVKRLMDKFESEEEKIRAGMKQKRA